jgi:hypothetical protein
MEKWEYRFEPSSKEAWIAQMENDLRGGSNCHPQQRIGGRGEPLIPFQHKEEFRSPEPIILPAWNCLKKRSSRLWLRKSRLIETMFRILNVQPSFRKR